ncbi:MULTISPECIES: type I restriction enzyme HsdR N-terminal domain-containing protein [unclassified Synechococcus]|uniref:type I restriction enzyme HsdR N-terminal domain-containing protein n=1 Tax=unclassified Synechococcus TaxID=2626047 RepID=UPI0018DC1A94|nr:MULTISPECIES: type I restriction enzyme HsdR N-terminal domain-containing protein [unclassified Synechococcus]WFN60354.1 type I restriction enzyme HsdR N-terminal domain-containing protein [Synechococcus sp. CCFWC 502]
MKSPDQFPAIAQALASDVESAASDSKRLKLRTLLAKFGYEKRSDSNTAEITKALSEAGLVVNPPLVRYGDNWEISTEDWIYLSIAKDSVESISRGVSPPRSWNSDGWFDRVASLLLRTEKEVEIKFAVPLLIRLGYSEEDRFDGMPVPASHGSRGSTLVIDHAAFNSQLDALKGQPLMTIEAKRDSYLSKTRQLHQAHDQAKSYCYWTQCDFFMVTDGQSTHVYRVGRGTYDDIEPLFECERQDLKLRFPELYELVSKESLTSHYLGKLSSTEEAT